MRIRERAACGVVVGSLLVSAVITGSGHASASGCGGSSVHVRVHTNRPGLSWAENIGFDKTGQLWVSRILQNVIERYDAHGVLTGRVRVESPGAVRNGPDGRMYAASGDSPINMVPGMPLRGTVVSFDPATQGPARVEARGLGMPNGLAFDAHGALYVADSKLGVVRIRHDGTLDHDWTVHAPRNLAPTATVNGTGMNGIAIDSDAAYVSMTSSLSGRVLRVPLDDPSKVSVAADSTAPLPGVIDDIAITRDSRLAVATTTGQVIVVDPASGDRCVVGVGRPATSVAVAPDGGELVVGTEDGAILDVRGVRR